MELYGQIILVITFFHFIGAIKNDKVSGNKRFFDASYSLSIIIYCLMNIISIEIKI